MLACTWDIEASDLDARFGVMLSGAIKPYKQKKVEVFYEGRKGSNDKKLLADFAKRLEEFDVLISHYGTYSRFDAPFLWSRLNYWGLKPLDDRFHIDTYPYCKKLVRTSSRRLEVVAPFFGIQGKTKVDPEVWKKTALDGDEDSLKKIVSHNRWDVIVLEQVFDILKPKIRSVRRI